MFACLPPPTLTLLLAVSQLPMVLSEHVRKSLISEIQIYHGFYAVMHVKIHLGNVLFLSSPQSALSTQSEESQSENRLS